MRAAEIIERIKLLFKRGTPQQELIDEENEAFAEILIDAGAFERCPIHH